MKTEGIPVGQVNCLRLHVYSEPNENSEVICKVRYLTEVAIDFYKIYTAIGAEGFCQKEFVTIK